MNPVADPGAQPAYAYASAKLVQETVLHGYYYCNIGYRGSKYSNRAVSLLRPIFCFTV